MEIEQRLKKLEEERRRWDPRPIILEVNTPEGKTRMDVDTFIRGGYDFLTDAHIVEGDRLRDVKKLTHYIAPGSVIE